MAMIFRQPGNTGIGNLEAGKTVGSFNGNNGQFCSNERKRKMKFNSIIFYLCAGMCSSTLIENAFSMDDQVVPTRNFFNEKGKLGPYNMMIVSKYFDDIDDFRNIEFATPKAYKNTDKWRMNPISITPDQLHLWSHLETLNLYTDKDIDTWIKAPNDIYDLHKIEVWPCISDKNAVEKMKELERLVAKGENPNAKITFHNVTFTAPETLGKINENGMYTFNENVYTKGKRKNANFVITSIDYNVFYECEDLKSITIPDSVTSIGDGAFNGCSGLTSFTIPTGVISLGDAFSGCTELTSITMSNNISGMHSYTFHECDKARYEVASEAMKKYLCSHCNIAEDKVVVDSSLYNEHYNWKWPEDGYIHFPADTTRIADYMFCGRSDIKSVDLTNVTYIGVYAFEGCTGLSSITIPNTVELIDCYAFGACNALTYVTISNSVTSIGHDAFCIRNYNAKFKVASESMKKLLCYSSGRNEYLIEVDSSLYEEQNAWKWPENGHIQLPADMTCIADYMFYGRSDILSIILQNSITSIGQGAFEECIGLISVDIPDSVTSIGMYAFKWCAELISVTIPNSVIYVGGYAFEGCNGLQEVNVFSEATKQLVIDSTPGINPDIIKRQ